MDTDIFKTAQFRPSSQVVGSRPVLKPDDVTAAVIITLETPPHVEVRITLIYTSYLLFILLLYHDT